MEDIEKLLGSKRLNPYYKKLKKALESAHFDKKVRRAYFLYGMPYSSDQLWQAKQAVKESKVDDLRQKVSYDVQVDNLELYLVEDVSGEKYIILLLDPYELFAGEKVLEIIPVTTEKFEKEEIFTSQ